MSPVPPQDSEASPDEATMTHLACHDDAPYELEVGAVLTSAGVRHGRHVLTVLPGGRWRLRPGPVDGTRCPPLLRAPDTLLAPALYDAHVHLHPAMDPRDFLGYGIARVRDLGSVVGADGPVRGTGCAGAGPDVVLGGPVFDGPGARRLDTAVVWESLTELPTRVDEAVERGASWLKLYSRFPVELIGPVVRRAHARGMRVALHPAPGTAGSAARAGVDELEHVACLAGTGPGGTHALNRRWARRPSDAAWPDLPPGTRLCPTLVVQHRLVTEASGNWAFPDADPATASVWRRMPPASRPWTERELDHGRAATREMDAAVARLAEQGVRLVAGSDTPNPGVQPGRGLWEELNLLVAAGLSPREVYLAASVTEGNGVRDSGDHALTLLPWAAFHEYETTGRYPIARVAATLVRGCLHTARSSPAAAPIAVRELTREEC